MLEDNSKKKCVLRKYYPEYIHNVFVMAGSDAALSILSQFISLLYCHF